MYKVISVLCLVLLLNVAHVFAQQESTKAGENPAQADDEAHARNELRKASPSPSIENSPTEIPTQNPVPGDANNNRIVDEADYSIWYSHYNTQVNGGFSEGDFNEDLQNNAVDYAIWLANLGDHTTPLDSSSENTSPASTSKRQGPK